MVGHVFLGTPKRGIGAQVEQGEGNTLRSCDRGSIRGTNTPDRRQTGTQCTKIRCFPPKGRVVKYQWYGSTAGATGCRQVWLEYLQLWFLFALSPAVAAHRWSENIPKRKPPAPKRDRHPTDTSADAEGTD